MNERAHGSGINPFSFDTHKKCARTLFHHGIPTTSNPRFKSKACGVAKRYGAFFISLTDNLKCPPVKVKTLEVESAEFRDPDPSGIQHLHNRPIAKS